MFNIKHRGAVHFVNIGMILSIRLLSRQSQRLAIGDMSVM